MRPSDYYNPYWIGFFKFSEKYKINIGATNVCGSELSSKQVIHGRIKPSAWMPRFFAQLLVYLICIAIITVQVVLLVKVVNIRQENSAQNPEMTYEVESQNVL